MSDAPEKNSIKIRRRPNGWLRLWVFLSLLWTVFLIFRVWDRVDKTPPEPTPGAIIVALEDYPESNAFFLDLRQETVDRWLGIDPSNPLMPTIEATFKHLLTVDNRWGFD